MQAKSRPKKHQRFGADTGIQEILCFCMIAEKQSKHYEKGNEHNEKVQV
jgi:hypothetical protein